MLQLYLFVCLLLFIATQPTFGDRIAKMMGKVQSDVVSNGIFSLLLCVLVAGFIYIKNSSFAPLKEPFLFSVSKCNPRCHGLYFGKPTTFQYDTIGCKGNPPIGGVYENEMGGSNVQQNCKKFCTTDNDASLGMIRRNADDQLFGGSEAFM